MAKNGLISKLKRGINMAFTAGALGLVSLVGCDKNPGEPDMPPRAVMSSILPTKGMAPLSVRAQYECSDDNGIREYKIIRGNETIYSSANPIDKTLTFMENGNLKLNCTDTGGQTASYGPINIEVLQPGFSQSASLQNDIDIRYNATLTNLDSTKVRVLRDGSPIDSFMIRTPTFTRLFQGNHKGNYAFIPEAFSERDTITVPNYPPTVTGMPNNVTLPEGDTTTINLPQPIDRNLEDKIIPYDSVSSRRNKVIPTLDGNQLHVKADSIGAGADTLDVRFGSQTVGFGNAVIPVNVQNLLDISGQLQDLRTDSATVGEGAIYTFSQDTLNISLLRPFTTDPNGNFSFRLDSPLQGDSIYLQARSTAGNFPDSNFVRTIVLPNRDKTSLIVRAYPYIFVPSDSISRDGIRAHIQELNPGFDKWDLNSLRGVEIIDVNPGKGSFTPEEQDTIEQTFRANLACYTGGRLDSLHVQKDNPSTPDLSKHYLTGERNWIFIFPDATLINAGGVTGSNIDENGVIYRSSTDMKYMSQLVTSHEQGHAFIAPFRHASTLQSPTTIMRELGPYLSVNPGPADCEAGRIIYEDTFRPRESYDRTLGKDFFRQYTTP